MKKIIYCVLFSLIITQNLLAQDSDVTKKLIKEKKFKPIVNMYNMVSVTNNNEIIETKKNPNDRLPLFIEGQEGFKEYLKKHIVYPEEAKKAKISGIVTFDFVITSTGKVKEIRINSSPSEILSNEVIRVIKNSGPWLPGIDQNKYKSMRISKSFEFK
jgi:TonB family protein